MPFERCDHAQTYDSNGELANAMRACLEGGGWVVAEDNINRLVQEQTGMWCEFEQNSGSAYVNGYLYIGYPKERLILRISDGNGFNLANAFRKAYKLAEKPVYEKVMIAAMLTARD